MYKNILVATDGSELSDKGVAQGIELARNFKASLSILTVSDPLPIYDVVAKLEVFEDQELNSAYNEKCKKLADTILQKAKTMARDADVECSIIYMDNKSPADGIIECAKYRDCDLIVMTSHGRRGLEKLIIGSQTAEVLARAKIPVLVVR